MPRPRSRGLAAVYQSPGKKQLLQSPGKKQLQEDKELFRDYDSALCRAATEANSREQLKEKVNLTARIAASRGFKARHAPSFVRRIVEVSQDPMAIKENLLFVADSIMRHAEREDKKIAQAFEQAFEPVLRRLFRAALKRKDTQDAVGEYLLKKIVPFWRERNWFAKELPVIVRILNRKISKQPEEDEEEMPKVAVPPSPTVLPAGLEEEPSEDIGSLAPWEPAYDPFAAERSPYSPSVYEGAKEPYVEAQESAPVVPVIKPDGPSLPPPTEPGTEEIRYSQESEEGEFVPTATGDPYTTTLDSNEIEKIMPPMLQVAEGEGEGFVSPYLPEIPPSPTEVPALPPSPTEEADGDAEDLMDLVGPGTVPTERASFSMQPTLVPSSQATLLTQAPPTQLPPMSPTKLPTLSSQHEAITPAPLQLPLAGRRAPSSPTEIPVPTEAGEEHAVTSPAPTDAGLADLEMEMGLAPAPLPLVSPTVLPDISSPTEVPAPTDQGDELRSTSPPPQPMEVPVPGDVRRPTSPAISGETAFRLSSPTEIPAPTTPAPSQPPMDSTPTRLRMATSPVTTVQLPMPAPSSPTEVPVPTEPGEELVSSAMAISGELVGGLSVGGVTSAEPLLVLSPEIPLSAEMMEPEEERAERAPTSPAGTEGGLEDLELAPGADGLAPPPAALAPPAGMRVSSPTELPVPTEATEVPAPTSPAPTGAEQLEMPLELMMRPMSPQMLPVSAQPPALPSSPTEVPAPTEPGLDSPEMEPDMPLLRPEELLSAAPLESPTEMPVPTQVPSPTSLPPEDMAAELPVPGEALGAMVPGLSEGASPTHIPSPTSPGDEGEEPEDLGGPPPPPGPPPGDMRQPLSGGRIDLRYSATLSSGNIGESALGESALGESALGESAVLAPSSPTEVPVPTQVPSPTSPLPEDVDVSLPLTMAGLDRAPQLPTVTLSPSGDATTSVMPSAHHPSMTRSLLPTARGRSGTPTRSVLPTVQAPTATESDAAEALPMPMPMPMLAEHMIFSADMMSAPPVESPTDLPVPTEQPSPSPAGPDEEMLQPLQPPEERPLHATTSEAGGPAPSSPTEMPVPTEAPSPTSVGDHDEDMLPAVGVPESVPVQFGFQEATEAVLGPAPSSPTEMPVPTEAPEGTEATEPPSPTELPDLPERILAPTITAEEIYPRAMPGEVSSPTDMPVPTAVPSPTELGVDEPVEIPALEPGSQAGERTPQVSSPTDMPVPTAVPSPTELGVDEPMEVPALEPGSQAGERTPQVSSPTDMPVPTAVPSPTELGVDEPLELPTLVPGAAARERTEQASSPTALPVPTAVPSPTVAGAEEPAALPLPTRFAGAPPPEAFRQREVSSPTALPVPTAVPSPTVLVDGEPHALPLPPRTLEATITRGREVSSPTALPVPTEVPSHTEPGASPYALPLPPRVPGAPVIMEGRELSSPTALPVPTAVPSPTAPTVARRRRREVSSPTELAVPTVLPTPTDLGDVVPTAVPSVPTTSGHGRGLRRADARGRVAPSSPSELPVPTAVPSLPTEELAIGEITEPTISHPTVMPTASIPTVSVHEIGGPTDELLAPSAEMVDSALPPSSPTEMPVPTAVPSPTTPVPEDDAPPAVQPPLVAHGQREYIPGSAETALSAVPPPSSPTEMPVPTDRAEPTSPVPAIEGDMPGVSALGEIPSPAAAGPPAEDMGSAPAPSSPTEMPVPTAVPSPTSPGAEDDEEHALRVPPMQGMPPELMVSAPPVSSPSEMPVPTAVPSPTSPAQEDAARPGVPYETVEVLPAGGPGSMVVESAEGFLSAPAPSSPTEMPVPTALPSPTSLQEGEETAVPQVQPTVLATAAPGSDAESGVDVESAGPSQSPTEMPVPTAVPSPTSLGEEEPLERLAAPHAEAMDVFPASGPDSIPESAEAMGSAPPPSSPTEMPVPTVRPSPTSPAPADEEMMPMALPPVQVLPTDGPGSFGGESAELVGSAPPSSPTEMPVPTAVPSPTSPAHGDEGRPTLPATEFERRVHEAFESPEEAASKPGASSPTEMPVPTARPSSTSPGAAARRLRHALPGVEPLAATESAEVLGSSAPAPSSPTEMPVPTAVPSPDDEIPPVEVPLTTELPLLTVVPPAPDMPAEVVVGSAEMMGSLDQLSSPTEMPVPTAVPSPTSPAGMEDAEAETAVPRARLHQHQPDTHASSAIAPSSPTEMPVPTDRPSPTSLAAVEETEIAVPPAEADIEEESVPLSAESAMGSAPPPSSPSEMPVPTAVPTPSQLPDDGGDPLGVPQPAPPSPIPASAELVGSAPPPSSPTEMPVPSHALSPTSPVLPHEALELPGAMPPMAPLPVRQAREPTAPSSPTDMPVPTAVPSPSPFAMEDEGDVPVPPTAVATEVPTVSPPRTRKKTRTAPSEPPTQEVPTLSDIPTRTKSVPTRSEAATRSEQPPTVTTMTAPTEVPTAVPTQGPRARGARPAPSSPTQIAVPTHFPSPTSPVADHAAEISMTAPPLPTTVAERDDGSAEVPMGAPGRIFVEGSSAQPPSMGMDSAELMASAPPPSSPTEMPVPTQVPSPTSMPAGDDVEDLAVMPTATLIATGAPGSAEAFPSGEGSAAFGSGESAAAESPTEMPVPTDVPSPTSPAFEEGRDMVEVPTAVPSSTSVMPTLTVPTERSRRGKARARPRIEEDTEVVVGGPYAEVADKSPTELPVPTDMPSPTSLPPMDAPMPVPAAAPMAAARPAAMVAAEELPMLQRLSPTSPAFAHEQEDVIQVPDMAQRFRVAAPAEEREEVQMPPPVAAGGSADYAPSSAENMGSAPAPSSPTEMPVPTDIPSPTSPAPLDEIAPVAPAPGATPAARRLVEERESVAVPPPSAELSAGPPSADQAMSAALSSPTEMPVPTDIPSPTSLAADESEDEAAGPAAPVASATLKRQRPRPAPVVEVAVPKRGAPSPTSPALPSEPTELPVPTDLPSPTSPARAPVQREEIGVPGPAARRRDAKRARRRPAAAPAGEADSSPTFVPAQYEPTSPAAEDLAEDQQLHGPPDALTGSVPTLEPTEPTERRDYDDDVPVPTIVPTLPTEPTMSGVTSPRAGVPTSPALPTFAPMEYPSPLMLEPPEEPPPRRGVRAPRPKRQRVAPQLASADYAASPITPIQSGTGTPLAARGPSTPMRRGWAGPPTPTGRGGLPATPVGGAGPGTPSYSPTEEAAAPGTPGQSALGRALAAAAGRTSSIVDDGSSPTYVAEERTGQPLPPTPTYTASSPTYVDDNEPPTPTLEPDQDDLYGDDMTSVATGTSFGTTRDFRRGGAGLMSPMLSQPLTPLSIIQGPVPGTPVDLLQQAARQPGTPVSVAAAGTPTAMRLPGMESPTPTFEADDSAAYADEIGGEGAGGAYGLGGVQQPPSQAAAAAPAAGAATGTPPGQQPPGTPPAEQPGTPTGAGQASGSAAEGMPPLASEVFPGQAERRRQRGGSSEEELPPWKRRAKRRGQGA